MTGPNITDHTDPHRLVLTEVPGPPTPAPVAKRPFGGWPEPLIGNLPADAVPCGACGKAVPDAATVEEVPVLRVADQFSNLEEIHRFAVTRCAPCAVRRDAWGWQNERLAIACELLGFTGTPGAETLTAAGIAATDAHNWPINNLLFEDWIVRAMDTVDAQAVTRARNAVHPQMIDSIPDGVTGLYKVTPAVHYVNPYAAAVATRAAQAAGAQFGHILRPQVAALRELQDTNRARWSGSEATVIVSTADAAHLLEGFAAKVDSGCGSCGARALAAPVGTRPADVWTSVYVPVAALGRGQRGSGYVGLLLCDYCAGPLDSQDATVGEQLAHCVLPEEVYSGDPDTYAPGALASALFASTVLQARLRRQQEPVGSVQRWGHLQDASGEWVPLASDPRQDDVTRLLTDADAIRIQGEENKRQSAANKAEIQRQAQAIADKQIVAREQHNAARAKTATEVAVAKKSIADVVAKAKSKPAPANNGWMRF